MQGYEEPVIATIGKAVLSGLNYMHPRGFIHRDIKGENVLVDEEGHVMLADFGVTAAMETRPTQGGGSVQSGSPAYGTSNPSVEVDSSWPSSFYCLRRMLFVVACVMSSRQVSR